MKRGLTRWTEDELPEDLAALLHSASGDAPEAAVNRLRARLESTLGAEFGEGAPASGMDPAPWAFVKRAAAFWGRKIWLGPAALVALSIGWPWWGDRGTPSQRRVDETKHAVMSAVAATKTAGHSGSQNQDPIHATTPQPGRDRSVVVATQTQSTVHLPRPAKRAHKRHTPVRAPAELGLAEELQQLRRIKKLLPGSPRRALAAARVHARRFPQGTLGQERELLCIEALGRLGRHDAARKLAAEVLRPSGDHAYRAQIEALLTDL